MEMFHKSLKDSKALKGNNSSSRGFLPLKHYFIGLRSAKSQRNPTETLWSKQFDRLGKKKYFPESECFRMKICDCSSHCTSIAFWHPMTIHIYSWCLRINFWWPVFFQMTCFWILVSSIVPGGKMFQEFYTFFSLQPSFDPSFFVARINFSWPVSGSLGFRIVSGS